MKQQFLSGHSERRSGNHIKDVDEDGSEHRRSDGMKKKGKKIRMIAGPQLAGFHLMGKIIVPRIRKVE